ncbi:MAG: SPOR domain-containing protein, partial [Geobacter sp.]
MRYHQRLVITALIVALSATVGCVSPAGSRSGTGLTASGVKYGKGVSRLGHSIQMGAFADVKNAERFTARLQAKGIEAFYFRKDNGIYAVRFGDFASKEKARAAAQRLVRDGLISGYYIAPPDEVVFGSVQPSRGPSDTRLPSYQAVKPPEIREPRATRSSDERDMGFIAARTAERFIGIPYQWGGNTVVDGLDCSGFVRAVYNLCGVSIPRTSREQYKAGSP